MKALMLMWGTNDAAGGTQEDIDAWAAFDAEVRNAGVLVEGGALQPPDSSSKLVRPELSRPEPGEEIADGTFVSGTAQVQAFYLLDCADLDEAVRWARRLPTWGTVEVRPVLEYDLGRGG